MDNEKQVLEISHIADMNFNHIEVLGELTEFNVKVVGDDLDYVGVVKYANSYIPFKGLLRHKSPFIPIFVKEFVEQTPIGAKVYLVGQLNSFNGVTVTYIALSKNGTADFLENSIIGVYYEPDTILVVKNQGCHQALNIELPERAAERGQIVSIKLKANPLQIEKDTSRIVNDGFPPLIAAKVKVRKDVQVSEELLEQIMFEREVFLEAMKKEKNNG